MTCFIVILTFLPSLAHSISKACLCLSINETRQKLVERKVNFRKTDGQQSSAVPWIGLWEPVKDAQGRELPVECASGGDIDFPPRVCGARQRETFKTVQRWFYKRSIIALFLIENEYVLTVLCGKMFFTFLTVFCSFSFETSSQQEHWS